MTRSNFETTVCSWPSLLTAASRLGYSPFDDYMCSDEYINCVNNDIDNRACSLETFIYWIDQLPSVCVDWAYSKEGWLEYYAYGEDSFYEHKANVIAWADQNGIWDLEENAHSEGRSESNVILDDGFSLELFSVCVDDYVNIK